VEAHNPKVVQSAMGSLFRMRLHYSPLPELLKESRDSGNYLVLGAAAGGQPYHEVKPGKQQFMLVIGSESHGISSEVAALLDASCGIPRSAGSKAESLNAAVACAVLLAHFQRV
jgi:TrmH family RNA methyltransferase